MRKVAQEWITGYLFYAGILAHFLLVFMILGRVALAQKERGLTQARKLAERHFENAETCTALFKDKAFNWHSQEFFAVGAAGTPEGVNFSYTAGMTYGQTLEDNHVYPVSIQVHVPNKSLKRDLVFRPSVFNYFEVDKNNRIVRCFAFLTENRQFECMASRGMSRANGDCLIKVTAKTDCEMRKGQMVGSTSCLVEFDQPWIHWPRGLTEARFEACEKPDWSRPITCDKGTNRCQPVSQCQPLSQARAEVEP